MANVQFDENQQFGDSDGFQSGRILGAQRTSNMVRLLGKIGIRDEKTAMWILVFVTIGCFATAAAIIFSMNFSSSAPVNSWNIPLEIAEPFPPTR